jgi:hypothetical protein
MKLSRGFKALLLWTSAFLYLTGLAVWLLATRLQTDNGYGGFEPSPWKATTLHAHSIAGLAFLGLFGYLVSVHVEPGLKQRKKKRSGLTLLVVFGILFLTVPFLFYATGETARAWTAAVHTWLGAALLAPLLFHLNSKRA